MGNAPPFAAPVRGVSLIDQIVSRNTNSAPKVVTCEAGHSRSAASAHYRYIYSPMDRRGRRASKLGADGTVTRHPGSLSVEQLYDLRSDPDESVELISKHGLLLPNMASSPAAPIKPDGAAHARAFAELRAVVKGGLLNVSARCGV